MCFDVHLPTYATRFIAQGLEQQWRVKQESQISRWFTVRSLFGVVMENAQREYNTDSFVING